MSVILYIIEQLENCISFCRNTVIFEADTLFFSHDITIFDILFGGSVILLILSLLPTSDERSIYDDY